MQVIQGYVGKSIKLVEILQELNKEKVLLVDIFQGLGLYDRVNYVVNFSSVEEMWSDIHFGEINKYNEFIDYIKNNNIDLIVFYVNDVEENLYRYKQVELDTNIQCIATIQDENEILLYEI
jgi:hypothetical protein